MNLEIYLIVSDSGSVKCRKTYPDLAANEIPVLINLQIPDELFNKPRLQASISVPEDAYQNNPITTEAINNIRDEIEHRTGLDFEVTLISRNEEDIE